MKGSNVQYADLHTNITNSITTALGVEPAIDVPHRSCSMEHARTAVLLKQVYRAVQAMNEQLSVLLLSGAADGISRKRQEKKIDALMGMIDSQSVMLHSTFKP